ncbi:hypothetical protein HY029_00040 [Candidatus Gottesmanbacteria bacterium]|nr:hypothetical protein [Candidatus Gottesmanbacteria bacterium]
MSLFLFLLNLPFTLTGVVPVILSGPYSFKLNKNPIALIFKVKSFWWAFGYFRYARAMTVGHIILMGPKELKNDLEHEIIHVKQCERYPVIFPLLYLYELLTKGVRQNRFEKEAYTLSKSVYRPIKQS